ncbi:antitoxin [Mycolicibacter virginiensis]|uniref:Antitoxin n=2 Tax=Mycobacteriaceae TaxID=1762 RepID=A0A9X7NXS4_9MYCO|nr:MULTISPECIES: type II toxin-antitoxin system CcdA family antitoxin [Mycobacteriaceae]PQM51235.1 antitoxin [Mycolicibacter virginiensis]
MRGRPLPRPLVGSSAREHHVCILVRMARLNVYVPDDLAERARARGLNISALTQAAISAELENSATDSWLDGLEAWSTSARHDDVLTALDAARDELGA